MEEEDSSQNVPDYQRRESVAVPLAVNRRVYNLRRFDRDFGFIEPDKSWHVSDRIGNSLSCSVSSVWKTLVGFLPILQWLPSYRIKEYLASDIIAGLTIAIVHIPQGMAYASLASLEPVFGLYTSFFPSLFYMFMGTSKHVSLGVFAVVSLMTGQVRLSILPDVVPIPFSNETSLFEDVTAESPYAGLTPVDVTTALALTVGLVLIVMGMLQLDFITAYLSDQVVSGFTTGAACHVFTAQLNKVLNISLPRHKGPGAIYRIYRDLLSSMPSANIASVIMSIITMFVLVIGKEFINPPFKKRFKIPIPFELVVVIGGTVASYFGNFYEEYHMKIVNVIPTGLPAPRVPPLWLIPTLLTDAIGIAVVAFVVTISLGKMFAKKHHYKVDARQELYALGIMECLCSLFRCYPASTALARSLVYEQAGAKTQLAALFTSLLLCAVLLWMGPLFKTLPMCVLASIIIVALKGMFMQFGQLVDLWPVSKIDFLIWLVSFLATVFLDVREGLIVSVLFAVLSSVVRSQRPPSIILGRLAETDIYTDLDRYRKVELVPNVCVFRFDSPLMFTNCERFREEMFEQCHVDLQSAREQLAEQKLNLARLEANGTNEEEMMVLNPTQHSADGPVAPAEKKGPVLRAPGMNRRVPPILSASTSAQAPRHLYERYIVLDCSGFNYVDYMGVQCLMEVYTDLAEIDIGLLYANFKTKVRDMLDVAQFYNTVPKSSLYPTINDAVVYAQSALTESGKTN